MEDPKVTKKVEEEAEDISADEMEEWFEEHAKDIDFNNQLTNNDGKTPADYERWSGRVGLRLIN